MSTLVLPSSLFSTLLCCFQLFLPSPFMCITPVALGKAATESRAELEAVAKAAADRSDALAVDNAVLKAEAEGAVAENARLLAKISQMEGACGCDFLVVWLCVCVCVCFFCVWYVVMLLWLCV